MQTPMIVMYFPICLKTSYHYGVTQFCFHDPDYIVSLYYGMPYTLMQAYWNSIVAFNENANQCER